MVPGTRVGTEQVWLEVQRRRQHRDFAQCAELKIAGGYPCKDNHYLVCTHATLTFTASLSGIAAVMITNAPSDVIRLGTDCFGWMYQPGVVASSPRNGGETLGTSLPFSVTVVVVVAFGPRN